MPKVCAVCGKVLTEEEVRIVESRNIGLRGRRTRRTRYLCSECRQKEYQSYVRELRRLFRD